MNILKLQTSIFIKYPVDNFIKLFFNVIYAAISVFPLVLTLVTPLGV
jgi:hypothetical protein